MCIITPYIGTRAVVYKEVFALLPDGHPHRAQLRISILTSEAALARTGIRADDTVVDSGASMPISLLDRRQLARRLNYLEGLQGDRRADRLVEIGTLGWLEFQKAPSRTLLRETVDTLRQAQNEIAPSHPSRFTVLRTLGDALRASFRMTFQDLPSLSGAISAYEEAIQVCPVANDARPVTMSDMAALLDDRSLLVGDPDSLRAAVDLHRQAISMLPRGHEARVECVISFLASLDHLFERTRDVDAGEEAVVLYEQTLANGEMTDAQRVQLTAHFGLAKINRFLYTADTTNIDEAIRLQREALATMDRTQAGQAQLERPAIVTNLAIALHMRFEQTDDLRALDESVRLHADSLERMPLADPHRSRALMSLANALQERGRRVDDLSSVRKALDYYAQAALLRPRGHSGRAFLLMNRSGAVAWVAKKTGSLVEMSEALSAALEALSLQPPESPQEPAIRGNISRMLMQTYLQIGFLPFLAKAILGFRQVIDLTPRSDPQRKLYLVDLATALIAAFEKFKTPFLLDESAALVDELEAESTPVDHPIMLEVYEARARLCTTAGTRYWQPSNAIRTLTRSLAMTEVNLVERVNRTVVGLLLLDRELAVAASDTLGSEGNGLLLDLYKETIKLVPRYVASLGDDARQQLRELQQIRALGAQAAVFTLAQNRPKIALHLLETARSAFWNNVVRLRNTSLDGLPPHMRDELRSLFRQLDRGQQSDSPQASLRSRRDDPISQQRWQQNARLEKLAGEVRQLPGFDRFLLTPTFATLASAAAGTVIAVLIPGRKQCEALVVREDASCTRIPLPAIDERRLQHIAVQLRLSTLSSRATLAHALASLVSGASSPTPLGTDLMFEIWDKVVQPILNALKLPRASGRARPRLHWCPTGAFNVIPLHAAGDYRSDEQVGCSDFVVSSYTPTLSALLNAKKGWHSIPKAMAKVVLVGEAAGAPGMPRLRNVDAELEAVEGVLNANGIDSMRVDRLIEGSTVDKALHKMKDANIVHFACHGTGHSDVLESGFQLRDGTLTIRKLMALNLSDTFLAFMSACATAKVVPEDPDQAMHLGSVLLCAGFRSVIGTLWSMQDEDGPVVAERVYAALCRNDGLDPNDIPYALDEAVQELRKLGLPVLRWAPFVHIGA